MATAKDNSTGFTPAAAAATGAPTEDSAAGDADALGGGSASSAASAAAASRFKVEEVPNYEPVIFTTSESGMHLIAPHVSVAVQWQMVTWDI